MNRGGLRHERAPRLVDGPISQEWFDRGACRGSDPDVFFPGKGQPTAPARAICAGCPVRVDCLEYAIENHERWGIWGGKDLEERRAISKARRVA